MQCDIGSTENELKVCFSLSGLFSDGAGVHFVESQNYFHITSKRSLKIRT